MSVLSIFSGAGGDSLGYKMAGFDVQMAVDLDKDCVRTYSRNLKSVDVYRKDIRDLDLVRNDFNGMLVSLPNRRFDGVVGGTPCQDSSQMNHSTVEEKDADEDRNLLVFEPIRLAVEGNMRFIQIENVDTFKLKEEAMKAGRDAGYNMFEALLYSSDFGVSQRRRRWFLVGLRDHKTFKWPEPIGSPPTLRETMGKMDKVWGESEKTSSRLLKAMEQLDNNPEKWIRISGTSWKNGIAWLPDGIATCLVNPQKSYQKVVGVPGKIPLSLAAMIQGFPNQWIFHGGMSSVGQQIVNACPPLLVKHIALEIKRRLSL